MKTLRGRTALITGAANGIGRAIALALGRAGCDLHLVDVDATSLERTCEEARQFGAEAAAHVCDLSQPEQVRRCIADVLRDAPAVHVLVNNAGVACYGPIRKLTDAQWDRTLAVNLLAPLQLTRELLPVLAAQDEAHILNVCSIAGLVAIRKLSAYQTSKFALVGFTQSLRADLRKTRIGATALCPGFVTTQMAHTPDNADPSRPAKPMPDWLCTTPERVARAALCAIRRNRALVVTTPLAKAMFALWRLSPGLFDMFRRYL